MACITRRRDRWVVDFYDQNGSRRWKTLKQGTTRVEAKEALRRIEDQVAKGVFLTRDKTPTFQETAKEWLQYKRASVRGRTAACLNYHILNHFEELNTLPINRITTPVVEKWINRRRTECRFFIGFSGKTQRKILPEGITETEARRRMETYKAESIATEARRQGIAKRFAKPAYTVADVQLEKKKMALAGLRKLLVTFNQIMQYAVRHKLIDTNPVRDAERPRKSIEDRAGGKIAVLFPEQIRAMLDATPDRKYRTLFLFAIMTGCRQGECLGLRWSDIDFEKKQVHILRTFNHQTFYDPKTAESIRKIDMAPTLVRELRVWKLASPKNDDDLVFANEAGGPLNYSNMVKRFYRKALHDAGIPKIRFHDLRHTFASLLLAQGENVKYIQVQLGHSNPSVTLNVYSHLMKSENPEAACRLEKTIFSVDGSNLVADMIKGVAP